MTAGHTGEPPRHRASDTPRGDARHLTGQPPPRRAAHPTTGEQAVRPTPTGHNEPRTGRAVERRHHIAGAGLVGIRVNGESRSLPVGHTLDRLVAAVAGLGSGVAAAVNEAVVPKSQWHTTELREGDQVEVLTAVQGG